MRDNANGHRDKNHKHEWKLKNSKTSKGNIYYFWICKDPNCPQPNKMTINNKEPDK